MKTEKYRDNTTAKIKVKAHVRETFFCHFLFLSALQIKNKIRNNNAYKSV